MLHLELVKYVCKNVQQTLHNLEIEMEIYVCLYALLEHLVIKLIIDGVIILAPMATMHKMIP